VKIGPYVVPVREAPPSDTRPKTGEDAGESKLLKGSDAATISTEALERATPPMDLDKVDRLKRQLESRELTPSPARIAAKLLED
jgi:anti-sigma28 factor (negative regulator of flagellin synthesis)